MQKINLVPFLETNSSASCQHANLIMFPQVKIMQSPVVNYGHSLTSYSIWTVEQKIDLLERFHLLNYNFFNIYDG